MWNLNPMIKLFLTIILSFSFSSVVLAKITIRITNGEWEPFMSEYSPHYGANSHIVTEAFKMEGIEVEYGFYPWKRAYQLARKGKDWDASATWWPADETKRDFYLGEAVSETSFVFFHLKSDKFQWKTFADLKEIRIGGTLEYDYGKEFMKVVNTKGISLEYAPTDEMNFMKLLARRIDIFPNDSLVGYSQIRNNLSPEQIKLITHHPKEFEISTLHLIISKKSKRAKFFLEKFNSGFKKLKKSGKLDKIYQDLKNGVYDKTRIKWSE